MSRDSHLRLRRQGAMQGERGFTLVELLIASVLGMFLVATLTDLYAGIARANRALTNTARQVENARFALQLLREDIAHAGFWGSHIPRYDDTGFPGEPDDAPAFLPDPCQPFGEWGGATGPGFVDALLGVPLQVYTGPATENCQSLLRHRLAGTAVLVVRRAAVCVPGAGECPPQEPDQLYFQPSNCARELGAGRLYAFLDRDDYSLTRRDCTTPAKKYRFVQHIYFIRDYAVSEGDGLPSLVRSTFALQGGALSQRPAQVLVQGIEQLQLELGVDSLSATDEAVDPRAAIQWSGDAETPVARNRGDGVPDGEFLRCSEHTPCTASRLGNVVAARVYLLARTAEPAPEYLDSKTYHLGRLELPPFLDSYKRHVFSTSVRLHNIANRRAAL